MDKQTKKLVQNLSDSDPKVRYNAVMALGKTGDISLIDELDKVATLDQNPKVRDLAYKAVRALTVLRQREQSAAREKLMKAADDEYEWQMLSGDISRQAGPVVTEIKWDDEDILDLPPHPDDAPLTPADEKQDKKRAKKARAKAAKQERSRGRVSGCFKVFLWAAACIGLLGATVVAFNEINTPKDAPINRADALYKLNEWVQDDAQTALAYQAILNGATLDCKAFGSEDEYQVPERPEWAGDVKEYSQEGLDPFFNLMAGGTDALSVTRQQIETACAGKDQLNSTDWAIGDAQGQLNSAFSALQQAVDLLAFEWQKLQPQWPTS
ncbi:MAG: HEAT repeat domain-containing protein [Chloroflexi bacterium]|nr:HEAT repeat domain-containing protein [Chloroflexota bacterium]